MEVSPYRPRNAGHDYYGRGTYLVTLVVSGRERLLSRFVPDVGHKDLKGRDLLVLTPLGEAIQEAWQQIPDRQLAHGIYIKVHACVCMPDHFHGVIEVQEPMSWSLGDIIQAFKAFCTSSYQQGQGLDTSVNRPIPADCRSGMIAYVRRALLRQLLPDVLRRCLHVRIGVRSYGAFGNLFLLRWPRRVQVMCHRRHPLSRLPYEQTDDYASDRRRWETAIMEGCSVIVTPGISRGEALMKDECLERGFPLIHLQKEPIGRYWKPERKRFEACARGSLLILAPWEIDTMGGVGSAPTDSDYSRFHNLNTLAAEICAFDGEAKIIADK